MGLCVLYRVVGRVALPPDTPSTQDSRKEEIIKKRKIKYIIGIIWWQFRKKKIKRRLFERIKTSNPSQYLVYNI